MALLLMSFGASGCAGKQPVPVAFCAVAKPIIIDPADVLVDATARQILAHDQNGERLCGW